MDGEEDELVKDIKQYRDERSEEGGELDGEEDEIRPAAEVTSSDEEEELHDEDSDEEDDEEDERTRGSGQN
eukprot:Nk52_evm1s1663 gene=Nk52_evmTU1s1663